MGYVFDYLVLGVDEKGLIKKVFNQKEVLLRFQDIKKEIEIDHYGNELEQLFAAISKTIQDEEKLIAFLHSYKMFGLYFTGLYVPFQSKPKAIQTREILLQDFENQAVEEKITTLEENGNFTFDVCLNAAVETIKNYQGTIETEFNRVKMGYLEIETENSNIKYTTSWVG